MARRPSAGSIALLTSPELFRQNGLPLSTTPKQPPAQLATPRRPSARSTSSSQKLDTLTNLSNLDPDEVFAKHTVSEVKFIQQRLRAEADAKQEELRLMVGERYRDLLEASTSILSLAKSSKHVLEALEEMRDTVHDISPVRAPKRTATGEDKHLQALQSLSAHVKLLLDAPEHLWRLMERKAYLNAAWLFLLARVVHRALSQEDDDQSWHTYGIDVMEQMPLVQRQWDTITPFRSQISHRATLSLREATNSPGEVCATLLTLHLLESRPLPETLSIFLGQRTKTLSGMLSRNASSSSNGDARPNGKAPHRPRKVTVRETREKVEAVLDAISRTISTARSIFADNGSHSSLMKQALQFFQTPSNNPETLPPELQLTTHILLTALPSSSHLLLLPQNIRTYKPYIDGAAVMTPALQPQLRDKLESWFRKAVQDAQGAILDWFTSLHTVREVWDVRTSLLTWLRNTEGLESPERSELAAVIDAACLQQTTSVWRGALGALHESFKDAINLATKKLEDHAGEYPHDIRPVEYLFQAPSLPSMLQAGHGSVVATQFSKYKNSLRHQLAGRTPLLDTALTTVERQAADLQKDLSAMLKSCESESGNELVSRLSSSYRTDAEDVCEKICDVLKDAAANEDPTSRGAIFVARVCQELASSSDFFARIGCNTASSKAFRKRLNTQHVQLMESWQERTVSHIMDINFADHPAREKSKDDLVTPTRPSHSLIQALLSLSSELQQLGVSLEDVRRNHEAGSLLRRFINAYLSRLESNPHADDLQVLWDLAFLQHLDQLWESKDSHISKQISARMARIGDPDIMTASARGYLSRTQILLAGLLPVHQPHPEPVSPTTKPGKTSTLLLYGTPAVEQRFEPALELVKAPPRFGLLLVGGATVR